MRIGFWNVRGFNRPLKHNGVAHLIKNNRLCLLGILETKLTTLAIAKIINRTFPGWCQTNNFDVIAGGRILIIWNPAVIDLVPEDISPQKNSLELHRPGMSSKILPIAASRSDLMMPPQRDATLLGTPTVRAIPCGVSLIGCFSTTSGLRPTYFVMRISAHRDVFSITHREIEGLKGHLKAFNNLHFSHISVRAKDANLALQDAQIQLEADPDNATIRDSVGELRKKAVFLAEAERHFYYQKAKLHFLKMGDRNTKFFHDMVKRNAAKSSILAITKTDGTTIMSAMEIGQNSFPTSPHS
ncbi:UNVERIFIED_CONTAM: hypothetical protein Sangu_1573400 [Sesamum angustifolium]|uniref:Uncharacterized protein n=1 Tax=Sesamum angustifolium TaxID=2727405 RepID=A0AAW2MRA9_9LAMI